LIFVLPCLTRLPYVFDQLEDLEDLPDRDSELEEEDPPMEGQEDDIQSDLGKRDAWAAVDDPLSFLLPAEAGLARESASAPQTSRQPGLGAPDLTSPEADEVPRTPAEQAKAKHGPGLSGKALKRAKRAIYKKGNKRIQEKDAKRSQERRKARALNVPSEGGIEDFSIAKGGRCGRPKLEKIFQALQEGDINGIREVLSNFDQVPQPLSACFVSQ